MNSVQPKIKMLTRIKAHAALFAIHSISSKRATPGFSRCCSTMVKKNITAGTKNATIKVRVSVATKLLTSP